MSIINNWIFWVIIGAIIVIMAIIGYIAESTNLNKKKKKEKNNETVPKVEPTNEGENTLWSDQSLQPDEKKETIHEVPAADNWTQMPGVDTLPKETVAPVEPTPEANVETAINPTIDVPENAAAESKEQPVTETVKPNTAQPEVVNTPVPSEPIAPEVTPVMPEPVSLDTLQTDTLPQPQTVQPAVTPIPVSPQPADPAQNLTSQSSAPQVSPVPSMPEPSQPAQTTDPNIWKES